MSNQKITIALSLVYNHDLTRPSNDKLILK